MLSTNAGGLAVLAYGNARDLCLGLEVVLADGRIWNGLNRLRKDNTGYDLKQLFIGSEGTLGIITAAVLKLYPAIRDRATAFVAVASPAAALDLLGLARDRAASTLTAFELMPASASTSPSPMPGAAIRCADAGAVVRADRAHLARHHRGCSSESLAAILEQAVEARSCRRRGDCRQRRPGQ